MKKVFAVVASLLLLSGAVVASGLIATDHIHNDGAVVSHSGGTDAYGCHNDHSNGTYHCH